VLLQVDVGEVLATALATEAGWHATDEVLLREGLQGAGLDGVGALQACNGGESPA